MLKISKINISDFRKSVKKIGWSARPAIDVNFARIQKQNSIREFPEGRSNIQPDELVINVNEGTRTMRTRGPWIIPGSSLLVCHNFG